MPSPVNVIDTVTAPPYATLVQVKDDNGPYGPGDYNLLTFTTSGAFLLPAGTYQVNGTYGVLVTVNGAIPIEAGFRIGWNDPAAIILASGDEYFDRIAQVVLLRNTVLTPVWAPYALFDINTIVQQVFYQPFLGAGMQLGLHVEPNWHVDLFYLCIL